MTSDRPILVAIEGTEEARHAVRAAEWIARELGTGLVVAHAFDAMAMPALPRDEMVARGVTDDDLERADRRAAERMLARATGMVTSVERTAALPAGRPVPALRQLAEERDAELIVTGTTARGRLDLLLIGSVAADLATTAPRPVVVVPPGAALERPGPIVVAYDGSGHAERAARHAAGLARRMRRPLLLVHVTDGPGAEATETLAGTLRVVDGEPAARLTAVADEEDAALVVTGTRGRGTVASALLGSLTAELVRDVGRPVVVVPESAG